MRILHLHLNPQPSMAFSLDSFARLRPVLYHLTAVDNLERIRHGKLLESAAVLLERAGRSDLIRVRRPTGERVTVDDAKVHVRDQAPLYAKNAGLLPGWSFEDLIELLNRQVFFWPGDEDGPIGYGERHFGTYADEAPVILRVPFRGIVDANPGNPPRFCRYNSGSPRWSGGRPSPRGPDTFLAADVCDYTAGDVVEVTFQDRAVLPPDTQFARGFAGPWHPLFATE